MSTNTAATINIELVVGQDTLALHNALNYVLYGQSVWTGADKADGEALFARLSGLWEGHQPQDAQLSVPMAQRELSLAVAALKWMVDNTDDGECHTLTGVERSNVDALRSRLLSAQGGTSTQ
jgi:hypothetical protein